MFTLQVFVALDGYSVIDLSDLNSLSINAAIKINQGWDEKFN